MDITKRELLLRRGKERNTMELKSASYEKHEEVYDAVILEQWKACVEMANSNTEKRTNSNNIFITILLQRVETSAVSFYRVSTIIEILAV